MAKERICICLSEELFDLVEEKRGDIPRSRFIERLVQRGIDFDVVVIGYV
jgi:metal-responsive CopG/Arc/MetJ family transcriptional regulator